MTRENTTVTLLLDRDGRPMSVHQSMAKAEAHAKRLNANPFVNGRLDMHAPYTVEVWGLSE